MSSALSNAIEPFGNMLLSLKKLEYTLVTFNGLTLQEVVFSSIPSKPEFPGE
jgi:hypothetical protein